MAQDTEVAATIRGLLEAERGLLDVLDFDPAWYPTLLSQLTLAVGDDPIVYLGATAPTSGYSLILRVGIFTETMVVAAEVYDGQHDENIGVLTKVQSRTDLLRFELSGGSELDNESESTWAGGFRVRALYQSGLVVTVPANIIDTDTKRASVHAVLDGLRRDLRAPHLDAVGR
jgi:hypothetical protein